MKRIALLLVFFSGLTTATAADSGPRPDKSLRHRVIPGKVLRYANRVIAEHDTNGDGKLNEAEWAAMGAKARAVDRNRDQVITPEELAEYIARYGYHRRIRLMPATTAARLRYPPLVSPDVVRSMRKKLGARGKMAVQSDAAVPGAAEPSAEPSAERAARRPRPVRKFVVSRARLPAGLPSWFRARDRDGDGQVSLAEYDPTGSEAGWREFASMDTDSDGLITPEECLRTNGARKAKARQSKSHRSERESGMPASGEAEEQEAEEQEPAPTGEAVETRQKRTPAHRTLPQDQEARRRQKELQRKRKLEKLKAAGKRKAKKSEN